MTINRREFLKTIGVSSLLGLGGSLVLEQFWQKGLAASETVANDQGLKGKRWAMVVDVEKFRTESDYQKVIDACIQAHNIPQFENTKDEIKWIWEESYEHTFPDQDNQYLEKSLKDKPFLVMCNHCDNPPCVRACPTQATFKRPDGIVAMDYHRCIGCRFCMAACPFGARNFNFRDPRPFIKNINPNYPTRSKGVVEKCTFCVERLEQGLLPACVEVSNGAIAFGDLENPDSDVRKLIETHYTIRRKPELGTQPSIYYIVR